VLRPCDSGSRTSPANFITVRSSFCCTWQWLVPELANAICNKGQQIAYCSLSILKFTTTPRRIQIKSTSCKVKPVFVIPFMISLLLLPTLQSRSPSCRALLLFSSLCGDINCDCFAKQAAFHTRLRSEREKSYLKPLQHHNNEPLSKASISTNINDPHCINFKN
jgi:hypothetical protein